MLRQITTTGWPTGLLGRRDRMLLTAQYTAHLNRSKLAALTTEHLTVDPEKLTITVERTRWSYPPPSSQPPVPGAPGSPDAGCFT